MLGDKIQAQDLVAVFLVKTWLDEVRLKRLLKNLDFGQQHIVSKVTRAVVWFYWEK